MSESQDRVAGWLEVLARIERALEHALTLAPEGGPAARPARDEGAGPLAQLDQRLKRWQVCLDQVGREAAGVEAEIDSGLSALRDWAGAASQAREALLAFGREK